MAEAPLLGCVADDVTGATDLALSLTQGGMRVVQWLGVPGTGEAAGPEADAVVVALKSRSVPAPEAVRVSLAAWESLRSAGCRRFYFKYCSTFDSTDAGNIGPVAEALLDALGAAQTVFCPAFPEAGRTVYAGHLFVHGALLNESGMQDHPLNPMRDPDLVRVLGRQTGGEVGLLGYHDVATGPAAITGRLDALRRGGRPLAVTDALDEGHLRNLAAACADMPLVTGGSGLTRFLPAAYRERGLLGGEPHEAELPTAAGRAAVLSGSCSRATQGQVERFAARAPVWRVDIGTLMQDPDGARRAVFAWASEQPTDRPVLVTSTAGPAAVAAAQGQFGREQVAAAVESFHAHVARALVDELGVRRLVVAGGETSSAVAAGLGVRALRIGPAIAPGVPWTESVGGPKLALAFKSGNFGGDDFFRDALGMLP